jgi:ubiquinol-cytochrome c reductase cytochrome c subunit
MRLLFTILSVTLAYSAVAADAGKGKALYEKHGCWQCHGYVGQGGVAGKALAPKPMPFAAFTVFVRNSNGPMPPYPKEILSEDDLADIHAYLASIPAPKDYKSIPLLNQ